MLRTSYYSKNHFSTEQKQRSVQTVTLYMYLGLIYFLCNNYLHVCISQDIKYLFLFLFFVFFYQVSETNDPLEDIKSLFEPTTDSIQEQVKYIDIL